MIADISKGNFVQGLIDYHEQKVSEGIAEILFDPTISKTAYEKKKMIIETNSLRLGLKKGNVVHFSLSLNKGDEKLSNEKFLAIGSEYLEKMGYSNCPYIIYRHHDKSHDHIHIITSAVDLDGNRVSDSRDWKKSQAISRDIENSYKLIPTSYDKVYNLSLGEINEKKHRVSNSLKKIFVFPELKARIGEILPEKDLLNIVEKKMSNDEIKEFFDSKGYDKSLFDKLYRSLKNDGLLSETNKEKIISDFRHIKNISSSLDEFIANANNMGLYARVISGSGSKNFVLGDPKQSFYIKDKHLPPDLKCANIFNAVYDREIEINRQRNYIKRIVSKAVPKSISIQHFKEILEANNVEVIFAKNSGGIYGASFKSMNVPNPETFTGQKLDRKLTWKNISKTIELNGLEKTEKAGGSIRKSFEKENSQKLKPSKNINLNKLGKSLDEPANEDEKKKRGKDKDRGDEMEYEY